MLIFTSLFRLFSASPIDIFSMLCSGYGAFCSTIGMIGGISMSWNMLVVGIGTCGEDQVSREVFEHDVDR